MSHNSTKTTGEHIYETPSSEIVEIISEQFFAVSQAWDDSLDHELDWGGNNQFE